MSVARSVVVGHGTDTTNDTTIRASTNRPLKAGQRLILCDLAGANRKLLSAAGLGLTWSVIATHGMNNSAGGLSAAISSPLPSDQAGIVSPTGTLDVANAHKQWLLLATNGVPAGSPVDQEADVSAGSTGSLATQITPQVAGQTGITDELVGLLVSFDSSAPGTITLDDGAYALLWQQSDGSVGTIAYYERVSTALEQPTVQVSWQNQCRSGAILFTLKGTFTKPAASVARTDCVLFGIGLNFALDTFPDTYSELTSAHDYSGPGTGGLNRKFAAARANYATDTTLFPSTFSPILNGALVNAYADGCYRSYQNGHAKTPLVGLDITLSSSAAAAWNIATAYNIGDQVLYQQVVYQAAQANTGQTPDAGTQNLGTANWTVLGVLAPTYNAGTAYTTGQCVVSGSNAVRFKALQNSTGQTPDLGSDGLGTAYWQPYGTYWDTSAKGAYDTAELAHMAAVASATDGLGNPWWTRDNPFYKCPSHEMSNAGDTTPNGPGAGPPAQFITYFRHTRQLAVDHGYHVSVGGPIAMTFAPEWKQIVGDPTPGSTWTARDGAGAIIFPIANSAYNASAMWPGSAYVDLGAVDVYSHATSQTADLQWPNIHAFYLAQGKPWAVTETGCDAASGDSFCVSYWQSVDSYLRQWGAGSGAGQVQFICFTSKVAAGGDYRMNASAAILAQFRQMALDPFYGGNQHRAVRQTANKHILVGA